MLRASIRALPRFCRSNQTAAAQYTVPTLPLSKSRSLPGLYSERGLEAAWYGAAGAYVARLNHLALLDSTNALLKTTPQVMDLVQQFGKDAGESEIYTNALYLGSLTFAMLALGEASTPREIVRPGPEALLELPPSPSAFTNRPLANGLLEGWIEDCFGSVEEFRTALLNSAHAVKGDGYTWLVARNASGSPLEIDPDALFIVNTYNAGVPDGLVGGGQQAQFRKNQPQETAPLDPAPAPKNRTPADAKLLADAAEFANAPTHYIPVLAIPASPRAYLVDYGVFGKRRYLENVWESIDWEVVELRVPAKRGLSF